ncbi:MAG: hypothetical protein WCF16_13635, partial [Alphaproteobacteria bacterium]
NTTGFPALTWQFPVTMLKTPTVTTYNPSATNANWRNTTGAAEVGATTADGCTASVMLTTSAGAGAGNNILRIHAAADAEI